MVAGANRDALSDLLAELTLLGREAAMLDDQFRAAAAAASEASARDSSEQVRVVLNAAGRIEVVEVMPGWRARLTGRELGDAVQRAYRDAADRRTETWAAEVSRAAAGDDSGDRREQVESPSIGRDAASLDGAGSGTVRDLWYLLQDATDRLDDLAREATTRSQEVTTGHDPNGYVTATLTGGELSGLHIDERWSAQAGGREAGTAITAAITGAYAAIDKLAEGWVIRRWPFPDLERFTSDPAALLSAIGLAVPRTDPDSPR